MLLNPDPLDSKKNLGKRNQAICEFLKKQIKGEYNDEFIIKNLALYAKWGCGKTSIIKYVNRLFRDEQEIDSNENYIIPIWFETWRFQHEKDLYPSLLKTIASSIMPLPDGKLKKFGKELVKFAFVLGKSIVRGSKISDPTGTFSLEGEKLLKGNSEDYEEISGLIDTSPLIRDITNIGESIYFDVWEILKRVTSEVKINDKKIHIVIFVDDLDRCMYNIAFRMLENLKIWFDLDGYTFIMALSDEEIVLVVKKYLETELNLHENKAKILAEDYILKIMPMGLFMDENRFNYHFDEDQIEVMTTLGISNIADYNIINFEKAINNQYKNEKAFFEEASKKTSYRKIISLKNNLILESRIKNELNNLGEKK